MPRTRIFEVITELPDTKDGHSWDSYRVNASTAEAAIAAVKNKAFSGKSIGERVVGVRLIGSEDV